jgi:hypothetical protein
MDDRCLATTKNEMATTNTEDVLRKILSYRVDIECIKGIKRMKDGVGYEITMSSNEVLIELMKRIGGRLRINGIKFEVSKECDLSIHIHIHRFH